MNAHHKPTKKSTSQIDSVSYFSTGSCQINTKVDTNGEQISHCKSTCTLFRAFSKLPIGWQLDVVMPIIGSKDELKTLPIELETIISKELGQFYHVTSMNLSDLLEVSFLNDHIRQGHLSALSVGKDEEDVVCIDAGRLILSVGKDTYEMLGLPGRPSAFGSLNQRYVIEIEMTDPSFRVGKNGFEKIKSSLKNWPIQTSLFTELSNNNENGSKVGKQFEMLFSFRDSSDKPSTIEFPSSIIATTQLPTFTQSIISPSTSLPSLNLTPPPQSSNQSPLFKKLKRSPTPAIIHSNKHNDDEELNLFYDQLIEVREWLGKISLGLDIEILPEEEEEEKEAEEEKRVEKVWKGSWNGFFSPTRLSNILITGLKLNSSKTPYLSLSILPPPRMPISHRSSTLTKASRKKPNGKTKKRGRRQGDEDESALEGREVKEGGLEFLFQWPSGNESESEREGARVEWVGWAGQN